MSQYKDLKSDLEALRILKAARKVQERGWCGGPNCRASEATSAVSSTSIGVAGDLAICKASSYMAKSFTPLGAIMRAIQEEEESPSASALAYAWLGWRVRQDSGFKALQTVRDFNTAQNATWTGALSLFDRTIAHLEHKIATANTETETETET